MKTKVKKDQTTDELTGVFEFRELGRLKITKTAKLTGEKSFWKTIQPHLMSKDLEYSYYPDVNDGSIFAGFNKVGKFRKISE